MNALASDKVADYINDNFIATYLKVGTFQIVGGQKQGGNVASYFCQPDGAVVHAIPGKVDAETLLSEARWAAETRKYALTRSTNLTTGVVDAQRLHLMVRKAHEERFAQLRNPNANLKRPVAGRMPTYLPKNLSTQAQTHWYLWMHPLAHVDRVFPYVWEDILNERVSGLPVAVR